MRRVLVPVDGSASSDRAIQSLIQKYRANPKDVEIHLLNVQHPLSGDVNTFVDHDEIKQYHHDEGIKALTSARQALDRAGLPYFFHVSVGEPAEIIAHFADERKCDEIVMGAHHHSAVMDMVIGSVDTDVARHTKIPVTLVE
jgi:nucleotide-binding universal stress UspA family protein